MNNSNNDILPSLYNINDKTVTINSQENNSSHKDNDIKNNIAFLATPEGRASKDFSIGSWHWMRSSGDPSVWGKVDISISSRANGKLNGTVTMSTKGQYSSSYWGWRWLLYLEMNGTRVVHDSTFKAEDASMVQSKSYNFSINVSDSTSSISVRYSMDDRRGEQVSNNGDSNGWMYATYSLPRPTTTYTVTYNGNGGIYNGSSTWSNTATYNSNYKVEPNFFTRRGYIFNTSSSWSSDYGRWIPGQTYNWVYDYSPTLYAQWTPITYTIKYNSNGGNAVSNQTVKYDNTITIHGDPGGKTGYKFLGWYDPTGCSWANWSGKWTWINDNYGITDNTLTLTARWEPGTSEYQVNHGYMRPDGQGYDYIRETRTATTDTTITVSVNPENGFTSPTPRVLKITPDYPTIEYLYTRNSYTATFNGNGGSNGTSITKLWGNQLGTLPSSTKTGYTFQGWYTAASGGN